MPRKQRFKPSRKPKPVVEAPSETMSQTPDQAEERERMSIPDQPLGGLDDRRDDDRDR